MTSAVTAGARGGSVTVAGQILKLAVQLGSVVVLSRLLTPADFGIIAMVAVVVAFGDILRDFGMPTAALQAPTLSNQQASNLFWVNSALGFSAAAIVAACTPLLVAFYGEPALGEITPVLALVLAMNGAQAQFQVQLARRGKFAILAGTDVLAQVLGLAAATVLAIAGAGFWALVVQLLMVAFVLLAARWISLRWIPNRPRRGSDSLGLVKAGGHFGLAQLLTFAAGNADTVTIGARWGATHLGYYNRAFQLMQLPIAGMLAPLTNVVIPMLNREREAGRSSLDLLLRIQYVVGVAVAGLFAVTAATVPELIPAVLGPDWAQTGQLFQILAIGGTIQAFSFVSYWTFISENKSRQLVYFNLVTKTLTVVLVVVGSLISVEGAAIAYVLSVAIGWPINLVWLRRTVGMDARAFALNGVHILCAALGGFLLGRLSVFALGAAPTILQIVVSFVVSGSVMSALLCATPKGRTRAHSLVKMPGRLLHG